MMRKIEADIGYGNRYFAIFALMKCLSTIVVLIIFSIYSLMPGCRCGTRTAEADEVCCMATGSDDKEKSGGGCCCAPKGKADADSSENDNAKGCSDCARACICNSALMLCATTSYEQTYHEPNYGLTTPILNYSTYNQPALDGVWQPPRIS